MQMRDELGSIYADGLFADLYLPDRQPAVAAWWLALATVMQFADHLSNRQAAEAVRAWSDWKYALSLELPGSHRLLVRLVSSAHAVPGGPSED